MNGINTSINNAVNSYRQAYYGFKSAAFDAKGRSQQASSGENADAWRRSRDGFENTAAKYCESNKSCKRSDNARFPHTRGNNVGRRRYDGFDSLVSSADKSGGASKPSNTDKADFTSYNDEEAKKARELAAAYEYFRKAAASGGYSIVRCGSDSSLYSYGIRSGKKSVIMIDPEFMNTIRDDPEMLKKYADEIETMKKLDKQFERSCKQQGKTIVSRGWRIEKDGSISSWSVVKTERKAKKGSLERMRETQEKLLKKKAKKKKEQAKLEEKRSKRKEERLRLEGKKKSAMRENIKRKTKKAKIYEFNRIVPKSNPNKMITSISGSCGSSPSLLNTRGK